MSSNEKSVKAGPSTSAAMAVPPPNDPSKTQPKTTEVHDYELAMTAILKIVKTLLPSCSKNEERAKVIQGLEKAALDVIKGKIMRLHSKEVTEAYFARTQPEDMDKLSDEELIKYLDDEMEKSLADYRIYEDSKVTEPELKNTEEYFEFQKVVEKVLREDCNEPVPENTELPMGLDPTVWVEKVVSRMTSEKNNGELPEVQIKDPMTGEYLEDPIENKICSHAYNRSMLSQSDDRQNYGRCSFPGCTNDFVITKYFLGEVSASRKENIAKNVRIAKEKDNLKALKEKEKTNDTTYTIP